MTTVEPAATAVTIPVDDTKAILAAPPAHTPPATVLESVADVPGHIGVFPEMGPGDGFIVMLAVTKPHAVVYVTVAIPAATVETVPAGEIVATEAGLHDQVPPGSELPRLMDVPEHTGVFPVTGPGSGSTVTTVPTAPHAVV